MNRTAYLFLPALFLVPVTAFSQETVTGLWADPSREHKSMRMSAKGAAADTLTLPFFDDFSGRSVHPDQNKWTDNNVFINNTYSDKQVTMGVATLDALDSRGMLYETASSFGFRADVLTSAPIDLNYPPGSGIWLSFLFERGGLSDFPELNDSLTLQFYSPLQNVWKSVWKAEGGNAGNFHSVMIHINDPRWLRKGFQFRFINYATTSSNLNDPSMIGNCDIWNIDYVRLDRNRTPTDTLSADVSFRLPVRSVLKNHEAMPWKQFSQVYLQEMGSFIPVHYRNNDTVVHNITRDFEIFDVYGNFVAHSFTGGAINAEPGVDVTYNANLVYTFSSSNPDSALFRITCSLKTDEFDPKGNDSIIYYQVFKNYFAFDDGSSEGGYGINGLGSRNAMFAYRFTSYIRDTLRAVDICFNDSYQDANRRSFDLMIWDDINGLPGNVIFRKEEVIVEPGSGINGFYRYLIPGGVETDGVFYVGWKQRSETFLNAGFDINTAHEGRQMYWLNGEWIVSQVAGNVMIRPVLGLPVITGTESPAIKPVTRVRIWPNPAGDHITVSASEHPFSSSAFITITDMAGHELMRVPFSEFVDISGLRKGMYIVTTIVNGKKIAVNRLIKSK